MEAELTTLGALPTPVKLFHHEVEDNEDEEESSGTAIYVSLCTTGKLLAIVTPFQRAQFLVQDEASKQPPLVYHSSFEGLLDTQKDVVSLVPRVQVTALIVFPIAFKRDGKVHRASIALVGFSDGYVRGYSKSGQVIFSEQLHLEAVTKLSFMWPSPAPRNSAYQENIVVAFGCVLCTIEGWSLVQVIQSNVAKMNEGVGWSEHDEQSVRLVYRKWSLKEQSASMDVAMIGHSTPSVYDYLCEASSVTGFEASIRSGPTPEAGVISVGENPMVALYKLSKDAGQINVSEVVHAVASKMKNAVLGRISQAGGWLGWGGQQPLQQTSAKNRPVDERLFRSSDLAMDSSIPDSRRSILSIVVSPLSTLAALIDSFGRVLLLDCETFAIRRMWKGYRYAQCGWILVSGTTSTKAAPSESGRASPPRAQCLCIYATRRGILEVWPTVYGGRLAAFHVGKRCKLMYSPNGLFSVDVGTETLTEEGRLRNKTVLLSPCGSLLTVSVPFPNLIRSDDPVACDAILMKKFLKVIKLGEIKEVMSLLAKIRSAKFLKQAVDSLIKLYPLPQAHRLFLLDVVDTALKKVDHSNPKTRLLLQYLLGCRQIIKLKLSLDDLKPTKSLDTKPAHFSELLGMPPILAAYTENMLETYYKSFSMPKKVIKDMEVYAMIQSFQLPLEVGDELLSKTAQDMPPHSSTVKLVPKDEADSCLLDLGCRLFLPLLNNRKHGDHITDLFEMSGIPRRILLNVFSRVILSGRTVTEDLAVFHDNLYKIFFAILKVNDQEDEQSLWMSVCRQCAITSNVGHAFSIVLIHQGISSNSNLSPGGEGDSEAWESVTAERGHWATLHKNLEILVHLCNVVGLDKLKKLPSLPFDEVPDDEDEIPNVVDPSRLKFFDKVYRNSSLCAASLKNGGPCLVSQCLCEWIVQKEYLPELVLSPSHEEVSSLLDPLAKLIPSALNKRHLLVHSAWHSAHVRNAYAVSLKYINQMSDQQTISGIFGVLWCLKFENVILKATEHFKRGVALDKEAVELVSVCRVLFGYLSQFGGVEVKAKDEGNTTEDPVSSQSRHKIDLVNIVESFPRLNSTVVHTCLELLLLFEISLHFQGPPVNLLSFFPNWFRNSLKKGIFKSSWQEQVPIQLQQKRTKVLMEAVTVRVHTQSQPTMFTQYSSNPACTTQLAMDLAEFEDFVFLLGRLWELNLDQLKSHWTCSLCASGLIDHGSRILLMVEDKTAVLNELLSLAGYLIDQLIHNIGDKSSKLAVLAQTSPTLLEWMRKQDLHSTIKRSSKLQSSWNCVSQLISLIIPYLTGVRRDKATQMDKIVRALRT